MRRNNNKKKPSEKHVIRVIHYNFMKYAQTFIEASADSSVLGLRHGAHRTQSDRMKSSVNDYDTVIALNLCLKSWAPIQSNWPCAAQTVRMAFVTHTHKTIIINNI